MIVYIILLILVASLIYFNLKYYKFDLLSPSFLYNVSMFFSLLCSFIGLFSWNNQNNLYLHTVLIIIFSVLFFNVGELVLRIIIKKRKEKKCNNKLEKWLYTESRKKFSIENPKFELWKLVLQLVFVIGVVILVFLEVNRIARIAGYTTGGLGAMIKAYRSTSILFSTEYIEKGVGINIIVAQLQKVMEVICYVNLYFLSNYFFVKKENRKDMKYIFYLLIVVVSILSSLLVGSRMQLLIYIVFFAVICLFKLSNKVNYKEVIQRYWKKILAIGAIAVTLFYIILPLTGRKSEVNFVDYITFYFGASIPTLNIYIYEPMDEPTFFGEETFRGIQNVLYKLKLSDYIQPISKEWEHFYNEDGKKMSSNIYTSGKRYYHDFGLMGVIILQFINGMIMGLLYFLAKNKKHIMLIIFYAMYVYIIIDQVRDEYLFSTFVHANTFLKLLILIVGLNILSLKIDWSKKHEIKN